MCKVKDEIINQRYKKLKEWREPPAIQSWYKQHLDKQLKKSNIVDMTDDWRER